MQTCSPCILEGEAGGLTAWRLGLYHGLKKERKRERGGGIRKENPHKRKFLLERHEDPSSNPQNGVKMDTQQTSRAGPVVG